MQTINEKIEKYIKQHPINVNQKFISAEIIAEIQHDAFKAGVEFAQRWYTDEDELPPCSYEDFLIKGIDYEGRENMPDIGYMHSSSNNIPNKEKFISLSGEIMEITHWRPIELK